MATFKDYFSDLFCFAEYFVAGIIIFFFSISIYAGLFNLLGLDYRDDFNDPVIYDYPNESEFIEFLHDSGTYNEVSAQKDIANYRYYHSWRAKFDNMVEMLLFFLSLIVVTISVVQIFKWYRRFRLREKFDSWLFKSKS